MNKLRKAKHRELLWVFLLAPTTSFATGPESVLNNLVHYLQGPVARVMGVLVIIGCGYLCLQKQKFPKERFIISAIGLGLIFGAAELYSRFIG
ncbi:TPA: TrbC/VirB2 family protein [Legionella pneumophila]|nr:TrbC/VirB2 family protein [Legionella pneumophila]